MLLTGDTAGLLLAIFLPESWTGAGVRSFINPRINPNASATIKLAYPKARPGPRVKRAEIELNKAATTPDLLLPVLASCKPTTAASIRCRSRSVGTLASNSAAKAVESNKLSCSNSLAAAAHVAQEAKCDVALSIISVESSPSK